MNQAATLEALSIIHDDNLDTEAKIIELFDQGLNTIVGTHDDLLHFVDDNLNSWNEHLIFVGEDTLTKLELEEALYTYTPLDQDDADDEPRYLTIASHLDEDGNVVIDDPWWAEYKRQCAEHPGKQTMTFLPV